MSDTLPQLTGQQRLAIETRDSSIALSAGAGCGKTFVLTRRFLSELRPGQDHRSLHKIVAITFTERAAREMRDRIRSACRHELHNCEAGDVAYWQELMRGLDSARISTIHSFCANLLRAHAVDAGLDPQFDLLDAASSAALLRNQVSDAVDDLLAVREADCMELAFQHGLDRSREILQRLVSQRVELDADSCQFDSAEKLAAFWRKEWNDRFVPAELAEFSKSPCVTHILNLLAAYFPEHELLGQRCEFLRENLMNLSAAADPNALLAELKEHAKVQGAGIKSALQSDGVHDEFKNAFDQLRKQIKKCRDQIVLDEDGLHAAAQLGLTAYRLAGIVAERYQQSKADQGLLDFDDLLVLTRNLLRDSKPVRARAAAGIDFLMVDEFQDTDPVQADIVRMLCGDELLSGKLFLVGDAKQSIYRFRNADPAVFHQLRDEIPDRGRLPLTRNFRSQPPILDFVNCLFAKEMGDKYEPLEPDCQQVSPLPGIEFLFPSATENSDDAESRRQLEADWIACRIVQLLQDEQPRIRDTDPETGQEKLRRVRKGDIAVLFRALSNVALYEEAFRKYGIEYYLVGGRAFYAQQEVFDLTNLCRFLDDCDDSISLAGILRSPMFGLSDDSLFALSRDGKPLFEALAEEPPNWLDQVQRTQIRTADSVLRELRQEKDRIPLAALLNLAIERTGYDAILLTEFLGRRKLANLRKLIDMARQFDSSGLFTLKDFVGRLSDSVSRQDDEELAATQAEASDVVRLMTIHQSKGLEFPVVIVADMDRAAKHGQSSARIDRELGPLVPLPSSAGEKLANPGLKMYQTREAREDAAETNRLLYVATTRAADYLILSACLTGNRTPQSPWLKFIAAKFGLDKGIPALDPLLGTMSIGKVDPNRIPRIHVHYERPAITHSLKSKIEERQPLSELPDAVANAEPAETPPLFPIILPANFGPAQFSVSRIEEADAELRGIAGGHHIPISDQQPKPATMNAEVVGNLVHGVLEQIDFQESANAERLLDTLIRNDNENVSESVRTHVLSLVDGFRSTSVWERIASAPVCYRELDFLLQRPSSNGTTQSTLIAGIIDCVIQSPDGEWNLIDYKTGRRHPDQSDEEILVEYEIQLGLYAIAMRSLHGSLPNSAELVFLPEPIRHVRFKVTDSKLEEILDRVDAAIAMIKSTAPAGIAIVGTSP